MKTIYYVFAAFAVLTLSPSCFIDIDDDNDFFGCIDGDGPTVTEELSLSSFDGIELNLAADVYVRQGPDQIVEVEGKENIIDELDLDVNNGIWEIETRDCVRDIGDMKFYITIPDITLLSISGSGSMISENLLIVNDIDLAISGSGNMDLALEGDDIQARISGSGDLRLEGIVDELDFEISGSGDLRAFDLETRLAAIEIRGSGDAEVFVTEHLDVRISGSGNVYYRGNPTIDVDITGSGEVIDAN